LGKKCINYKVEAVRPRGKPRTLGVRLDKKHCCDDVLTHFVISV